VKSEFGAYQAQTTLPQLRQVQAAGVSQSPSAANRSRSSARRSRRRERMPRRRSTRSRHTGAPSLRRQADIKALIDEGRQ
jgi:hypothetical protein